MPPTDRPIVSFELKEARVSAGEAAMYAPANDESQFAKLIATLLDDPDKRGRMGRIGQAIARRGAPDGVGRASPYPLTQRAADHCRSPPPPSGGPRHPGCFAYAGHPDPRPAPRAQHPGPPGPHPPAGGRGQHHDGPDVHVRAGIRLLELEELLADQLDTRVKINMGPKRGRVVIEFADLEDLERIYRRMTEPE